MPATFFLVGEQVAGNEDLVVRMGEEGHQVGVHTYGHQRLTALGPRDFSAQVDRGREVLTGILGPGEYLLRPPYGLVDAGVRRRAGSAIILWSVDPEDWADKNAQRIAAQVIGEAQDGDVILLHDIYDTSVDAALEIVDALHAKGFLFVTVDELAYRRHEVLTPGEVYREFWP